MDAVGLTLLFPEQFGIADIDILLDTSETRRVLGWAPLRGDVDMMIRIFPHAGRRTDHVHRSPGHNPWRCA